MSRKLWQKAIIVSIALIHSLSLTVATYANSDKVCNNSVFYNAVSTNDKNLLTTIKDSCPTIYNEALMKEIKKSKRLNDEALALYKAGDLHGAIEVWEQAVKLAIAPGTKATLNKEASNNLGFAYYVDMKRNNVDRLAQAEKYLKDAEERWQAQLNLGDLYAHEGRAPIAAHHYEKLLEMNPNYKYADKIRQKIEELRYLVGSIAGIIHPNLPPLEVKSYANRIGIVEDIVIVEINSGKVRQTIKGITDGPLAASYSHGDRIRFVDINLDGYKDIELDSSAVRAWFYKYFTYIAQNGEFALEYEISIDEDYDAGGHYRIKRRLVDGKWKVVSDERGTLEQFSCEQSGNNANESYFPKPSNYPCP